MQADGLSRWVWDKGDYTLDRNLFCHVQNLFAKFICPKADMFASPGNHQLPQFVARFPHHQAVATDALHCPLKEFQEIYANPPGPS